ncbi:ChaN family lipoprotein [Pseudomonas schmalbachii]|uniref:ChaN family lipoprotein n=1 Tax=Pseudomonas schmalbachii TaxID=2816993 RepID=A0ABS3TSJ3_9PSED|nr:ChaN family lipoprotein [Pseudomonas schmalbachii]MBO3276662.1 ChaN family lipoprotein [Pseudomonas schmalbachii]
MRICLLASVLFLAACQVPSVAPPLPEWQSPEGRDSADLGVIRDLRTGERLSPAQLLDRLSGAPRVLVGEQHDNPDHHALELWLAQGLAERRPQGSVLMEMINPDQQQRVLRAQAATAAGEPPADLKEELAWQKGWDWSLYGPLVGWLVQQPAPLLSANLDRAEIMKIYKSRPKLSGKASTGAEVRKALQDDIRESHCGLLPKKQIPAMLAVQQQRDRRMAEQLKKAPQPALLFAGGFHVRRDLSVPLHLQDLEAGQGDQVVMLAEVGKPVSAQQADYVWYTPALPPQDHCAKIPRKQ